MALTHVYNFSMTEDTYTNEFNLQYSFNKDPDFQEDYFKLCSEGLKISIYKDDLPFLKNSKTNSRTELRGLAQINDGIKYTAVWDQFIEQYTPNYWFAFCQIFAKDGPNIMLRYKNNRYELLSLQGRNRTIPTQMSIDEDIGKWVNWKIDFLLLPSSGYVKVYKNDKLLTEINGNTSGGNDSFWKQGIYSQDMEHSEDMSIIIKNLQLYYTQIF